ncbi:NPCBM/NEW2 domain-containing protein [Streptomyces sp. NPDC014991]|uniref:NPCBM/NEW2 domain-containing protein n=1 Tax=Streptomyces sp. NPDC014991 TaxID=3364935 RepID=UPI003701DBD5
MTATETVRATATVTITSSPVGTAGVEPGDEKTRPRPSGGVALTDLTRLGPDPARLGPATMATKQYEDAILIDHPCVSSLDYSLNERYKTLTLTIGLDDASTAPSAKVTIYGDGGSRKSFAVEINRPRQLTVDVSGVVRLGIQPELSADGFCDDEGVHLVVADAVLHT